MKPLFVLASLKFLSIQEGNRGQKVSTVKVEEGVL